MSGHPDSDRALLATLQMADSQFPSGAFSLSHGLETLVDRGVVRDADGVMQALRVSLRRRLAPTDLCALLGAHASATDGSLVAAFDIDEVLSAVKLPREEREASCRVGRRLARELARLGGGDLGLGYLEAVETGGTPGNAAVAFGVGAQGMGVDARAAALACCHGFAAGFAGAAMRLGLIGHGAAQATIRSAQVDMAAAVEVASALPWREMASSGFLLDVAMAAHERAEVRMFAS